MSPFKYLVVTLAILGCTQVPAATHFVSSTSINPTPPYTDWSIAATNIQDAVNASAPGEWVVVTNGMYTGGILVSNPLLLVSMNGEQYTVIDGGHTHSCLILGDGASVSGFTLTNGSATNGGGVFCTSTNAYLTNCVIAGNRASDGGGAYSGTLYNCLLFHNTATNTQYGVGGGADLSVLHNCTLSQNSAYQGGGIFVGRAFNSILYYNTAIYDTNFSSGQILNYCCASPMPTNGIGNFTNAPLFVNDFGGDFHLQAASPCINAGANSGVTGSGTDLDGAPRISGNTVDLGAYEFQLSGPPQITLEPVTQQAYQGSTVTLQVGSHGGQPLFWNWLFNGVAIQHATNATYFFQATTNNAGDYSVIITNAFGAITSQVATLTVIDAAPTITLQPANQTVTAGTNLTLAVGAKGSLPMLFDWRFNGTSIFMSSNPDLALQADSTNQSGNYSVVVSNHLGAVTSQVAVVTILEAPGVAPQITMQSYYIGVFAGSNLTMMVEATGSLPLYWQWSFNGVSIPGATSSSYNLPLVMPDQAGIYSVIVSNSTGWVTSQPIQLRVDGGPPSITQQPMTQTAYVGADVLLSVTTADLVPQLSWQWLFAGNPIANATGPSLLLSSVRTDEAGEYAVVITNVVGAVTSHVAVLTVLDSKPSFTQEPAGETVYAGSNVIFTAAAVGSLPLSWQWLFNGSPISNATRTNLVLNPVSTNQAGGYSVIVNNHLGSITSQVATLTVLDTSPIITQQPGDRTVSLGESVTFTVQAKGSFPLTWQWDFNGQPVKDATNSSFTLPAVSAGNAGSYSVMVSNSLGDAVSDNAILTIRSATSRYVWQNSPSPAPPFTNWSTAAHVIQEAVDASGAGDEIIVTNGLYAEGGRTAGSYFLTNRVAIDKPLTLRSVNGPDFTVIQGYQVPVVTNGPAAIRCLYVGSNVVVRGFTLTNGATFQTNQGINNSDLSGGGVYCDTWNSCVLINCKLFRNSARQGGGAYFCALNNCLIVGNSAMDTGGGTFFCGLTNCTITANTANQGGGAVVGALYNCILYYNTVSGFFGSEDWLADKGGYMTFCCTPAGQAPPEWQNVSSEPQFINPANGDFRLQSTSPCIDAGNNDFSAGTVDLNGQPRVAGGVVDIGAYEFQASTPSIPLAWLQQYNLPTDGSADLLDADGDGMNNFQEWVCGTSPTNALSSLKLLSVTATETNILVSWQSIAGVNYWLGRIANVKPSAIQVRTNVVVVGTNIVGQIGITTYADTNTVGSGPVFYQVGVRVP